MRLAECLFLALVMGACGQRSGYPTGAHGVAGLNNCEVPFYGGIDRDDGMGIPRSGVFNPVIKKVFKKEKSSIEQDGKPATIGNCTFISGGVSSFGGPNDHTIAANDKGALTGERLRALNDPVDMPASADPQNYYYAAMRVNYDDSSQAKWKNAHLLLYNPGNQRAVIVRLIDWGPSIAEHHRIVDVSPQSLKDLGAATDDQIFVSFSFPDAPLGPL